MNDVPTVMTFQLREIFTFFFITLGPLRLIAPFVKLTAGKSVSECRTIALRGTGLATLTVLASSLIGSALLVKWKVSVGDLAIAGGILFFLVALRLVLDPYTQSSSRPADATSPQPQSVLELTRQTVSATVTPWGMTAVIFFLTLEPDQTWQIIGLLAGIMLLDLIAMLFARRILRFLGFVLQLIATVLSVLQVALSVQMVVVGIKLVATQQFGAHF